jgi:membrane-associated phospholipid phosphatase
MAYRNQSSLSHDITNVTDLMGSKNLMVPALLATFGGSFLIKDDKLKSTSWNAIKSVVTTSITVEMLKVSIGRARPFVGEGNMSFHPFNGNDIYKSMPSGHSSFAFALFTPFAETYSRWIYVLPASVAIGRVWQQKHWLSDVVIGGGIGWLSGYLFTHSKKKIVVTPNGFVIWF